MEVSASREAQLAVYRRLRVTNEVFMEMEERCGDMDPLDVLVLWDWFERKLDTKEAHEEAAKCDHAEPLVLPPADSR